MDILLVAATESEIRPAWDHAGDWPGNTRLLVTGVGMLSAAVQLTRAVCKQRPDLVIQAGIAGSFEPVPAGTSYLVRSEVLADTGVMEHNEFHSIFDLKLADPDERPFVKGRLLNPYTRLMASLELPLADAITVSEVSTSLERINWYQQKHRALVESMEGAALHYTCLIEQIPFLQLRSVSNTVGVRDKSKWKISEAISSLNHELDKIIHKVAAYDETYFRI